MLKSLPVLRRSFPRRQRYSDSFVQMGSGGSKNKQTKDNTVPMKKAVNADAGSEPWGGKYKKPEIVLDDADMGKY